MSSPEQQARQKRRLTRGDAWCTRPDDAPPNAPVPRYGWLVQHVMIPSDGFIYRAMESLKPDALPNARGRILLEASITRIAKATAKFTWDSEPMPRRTVAHRLAAMQKKGILQRWDASTPKTSPVGTSWRFPAFGEILESWRQDPEVYTPTRRAFFRCGKDRHLVTPEEATRWKLDAEIAEANPAAHASAIPLEQATATAKEPELPTPEAIDLGPLTDALIDVCGAAAADDARFVWKAVMKATGSAQPPSVFEACQMIHEIGRERRRIAGAHQPTTPGFVEKKMAGRVESWKRHQTRDAAERARVAKWERDTRINRYATYIRDLQAGAIPPDDLEHRAEILRLADPLEVAEAKRVLEQSQSRTA